MTDQQNKNGEKQKLRYYRKHLGEFRQELREAIPRETLRALHRRSSWKHFGMVFRQCLIAGFAIGGILNFNSGWIWFPCSVALGFVIFDFTILLHEVIHNLVFEKRRPRWNAVLGWMYALPSGLSRTQFTRWHLDHHDELGSSTDDPKRAHLTPKIVKRWYKLLYMTPALFPIYFRAAAREVITYPMDLQNTIRLERSLTIALHLILMSMIYFFGGWVLFVKLYAIPYFFIFPIAFTINRVGQHYNVNPNDVAQWSTLMKGHILWDFIYLFSNYHLEHHYFPGVPCYNLPRIQKSLQPLYDRHGMTFHSYGQILYGWFILNRTPHTDWNLEEDIRTIPSQSNGLSSSKRIQF